MSSKEKSSNQNKNSKYIPKMRMPYYPTSYKKKLVSLGVVALSLTTIMINGTMVKAAEKDSKPQIYLDESQLIGTVNKGSLIDELFDEKINEVEQLYGDESKADNEVQVSYVPELISKVNVDKEFKKTFKIIINSVPIEINGEVVGYVSSELDAQEVLKKLKLKYTSEEVVNNIEKVRSLDKNVDLEIGDSKIIDLYLEEGVSFSSEDISLEKVLTVEEAVELLQKGTLKEKVHAVEKGEFLGKIASEYDLSVEELLELNPELTEDSVLQIGQELIVKKHEPFLNVVIKEVAYKKNDIPFETEIVYSDDLYKGESKVRQNGRSGKETIRYVVTKVNGQEVEKEILEEKVVVEPQNKIVIKGTKVMSSRGTGDFVWPAVGGYITSSIGPRWGSYHKGIDISGVSNRTIKAVDNGTVVSAGWDNGGYGNRVVVNHNNGYKTTYNHLSSISVRVGETVPRGSKVGVMGTTGRSTGVHLHFEVYKNGRIVNPEHYY